MKPRNLEEFYPDRWYGKERDRDCYYAINLGIFEKIKLNSLKNRESGIVGIPTLQYNWFYNRKGTLPELAGVIGPDVRVPNYSTSLDDLIEIGKLLKLENLPLAKTKELIAYILGKADEHIQRSTR